MNQTSCESDIVRIRHRANQTSRESDIMRFIRSWLCVVFLASSAPSSSTRFFVPFFASWTPTGSPARRAPKPAQRQQRCVAVSHWDFFCRCRPCVPSTVWQARDWFLSCSLSPTPSTPTFASIHLRLSLALTHESFSCTASEHILVLAS